MIGKEPVKDFEITLIDFTEEQKNDELIEILTSKKELDEKILEVQNLDKNKLDIDCVYLWKLPTQPLIKIDFK